MNFKIPEGAILINKFQQMLNSINVYFLKFRSKVKQEPNVCYGCHIIVAGKLIKIQTLNLQVIFIFPEIKNLIKILIKSNVEFIVGSKIKKK